MAKGSGAAIDALNREIAKLRVLAASTTQLAPRVAEACVDVIAENVAAAHGPDGEAWELKADGHRAMQTGDPRKGLTGVALGSRVVITLDGSRVFHHRGQTRGGISRPIMPTRRLSQPMTEAIARVCREWFEESRRG